MSATLLWDELFGGILHSKLLIIDVKHFHEVLFRRAQRHVTTCVFYHWVTNFR